VSWLRAWLALSCRRRDASASLLPLCLPPDGWLKLLNDVEQNAIRGRAAKMQNDNIALPLVEAAVTVSAGRERISKKPD
jgi:hypothetical protein